MSGETDLVKLLKTMEPELRDGEYIFHTAAFAAKLGSVGISANVIAAYYHDHIFVGSADAQKAFDALIELSS